MSNFTGTKKEPVFNGTKNDLELLILSAALAAYLDSTVEQIRIISAQKVFKNWKMQNTAHDWKICGRRQRLGFLQNR